MTKLGFLYFCIRIKYLYSIKTEEIEYYMSSINFSFVDAFVARVAAVNVLTIEIFV